MGIHSSIFRSKMPLCLKRKVFHKCVLSSMTYDYETWRLNNRLHQKLQTSQRSMERHMLGIKWRWAGHIARMRDERWTNSFINWFPLNIKRPRRRPVARWIDEIKKYAGVEWQRKAGNRQEWRKLGEASV